MKTLNLTAAKFENAFTTDLDYTLTEDGDLHMFFHVKLSDVIGEIDSVSRDATESAREDIEGEVSW
jgi:hypothetical protein